MTQVFPSTATQNVAFCPFEDILGVGHARGFTSLIVPGAGEGSFDSLEADPFESKKARREREVVSLLDKLQPDQIHLDADFIGKLAPKVDDQATAVNIALGPSKKKVAKDFAQLSRLQRLDAANQREEDDDSDEENAANVGDAPTDDKAVKKPRGRNKVLKRVLRRKKNVIDDKTMRVRELIDKRRQAALDRRVQEQRSAQHKDGSALDRFV